MNHLPANHYQNYTMRNSLPALEHAWFPRSLSLLRSMHSISSEKCTKRDHRLVKHFMQFSIANCNKREKERPWTISYLFIWISRWLCVTGLRSHSIRIWCMFEWWWFVYVISFVLLFSTQFHSNYFIRIFSETRRRRVRIEDPASAFTIN